jgi:hypothetical protein
MWSSLVRMNVASGSVLEKLLRPFSISACHWYLRKFSGQCFAPYSSFFYFPVDLFIFQFLVDLPDGLFYLLARDLCKIMYFQFV